MRPRPASIYDNPDGSINLALHCFRTMHLENLGVLAWNEQYANACDRLASQEASRTGKKHYGRWYVLTGESASLVTRMSQPSIGNSPNSQGGIYVIALSRCETEEDRKQWLDHLGEKDWMSDKSFQDLKRAFDDLIKEGIIPK